jgi:hypothetical protein
MDAGELRTITAGRQVAMGTGISVDQLEGIERELSLRIVGGYRLFLLEVGWLQLDADEIYGSGDDVPLHLDLVSVTRSERQEALPNLPHNLLPVLNNGAGDLYCLDTASHGEPPVVARWHEGAGLESPELIAADFDAWLRALLGA